MRYLKIIFLSVFLFAIAISAFAVNAINAEEYGLPATNVRIETLVETVLNWTIFIAGPACMVALIYGGIRYAFAGGNDDKAENAKKVLRYAATGIVIIMSSYIITQIILKLLKNELPPPSLDSPEAFNKIIDFKIS